LNTETAMKKIEEDNTLVFVCDVRATKNKIKEAVKRMYNVEVAKINTLVRPDGNKKAYVRLAADVDALDIANKVDFHCVASFTSHRFSFRCSFVARDRLASSKRWRSENACTKN
jgi:ribosomal protein L23